MATTPQNKSSRPADPAQLSAPEFRYFLKYFPEGVLQRHGVKRHALWGVGMALAQYGSYERGTGIRVSHLTLSKDCGLSHHTVKKVMELLKLVCAVMVTGEQRRGGSPSENYRLYRSQFVIDVLEAKDRDRGGVKKKLPPKKKRGVVQLDHSQVQVDHSQVQVDDDKNSQNEKNRSVARAPSPSSVALPLRGRDEEEKKDPDRINEMIADAFLPSDDELAQLVHGL